MKIPNAITLQQFNTQGQPTLLPGGEGRTLKVGNMVIEHMGNDNPEYLIWIAESFDKLHNRKSNISTRGRSKDRRWITEDGSTAWTCLAGHHDLNNDIPASIKAIVSFHQAIRSVPKPLFL